MAPELDPVPVPEGIIDDSRLPERPQADFKRLVGASRSIMLQMQAYAIQTELNVFFCTNTTQMIRNIVDLQLA